MKTHETLSKQHAQKHCFYVRCAYNITVNRHRNITMENTQISKMLATTAVFALTACGGGGSSGGGGGGSSAVSNNPTTVSTVWRNPTSPTVGILVAEDANNIAILFDSVLNPDTNIQDDTVWIEQGSSSGTSSPRYAVQGPKPNNIPLGTFTYDGYARVTTNIPTIAGAFGYAGSRSTSLQGPAQLVLDTNNPTGILTANFSGNINQGALYTSTLRVGITDLQTDGYMTGTGSYITNAGANYDGTSVFVGSLTGSTAQEFVGISVGPNHSAQLIGSR
jgi:hypothetical protein